MHKENKNGNRQQMNDEEGSGCRDYARSLSSHGMKVALASLLVLESVVKIGIGQARASLCSCQTMEENKVQ